MRRQPVIKLNQVTYRSFIVLMNAFQVFQPSLESCISVIAGQGCHIGRWEREKLGFGASLVAASRDPTISHCRDQNGRHKVALSRRRSPSTSAQSCSSSTVPSNSQLSSSQPSSVRSGALKRLPESLPDTSTAFRPALATSTSVVVGCSVGGHILR